jgi:hypothetical protein
VKSTSHIGFWLTLCLLSFLLTPFFRTSEELRQYVQIELTLTEQALGPRIAQGVKSFADAIFNSTPLSLITEGSTAAIKKANQSMLPGMKGGPLGEVTQSVFNGYMQGLMYESYVAAMRLAIVLFWLMFIFPMLMAALHDGFMQRKIKQVEFGSIRPATFSLMGMLVIPAMAMPLMYLALPFNINPAIAPLWAACVSLPLSVLISNTQPFFGR